MDSIVHGVAKSRTGLSDFHFHTSQALHGASQEGQAGGLCSRPGKGTDLCHSCPEITSV